MQNTIRWGSDRQDGAVVGSFLGTKVMQIRQRETTQDISCLAAESSEKESIEILLQIFFETHCVKFLHEFS